MRGVHVDGQARVKAALAALVPSAREALAGAITEAALATQRRAKEKCPVDTGRLRGSIAAVPVAIDGTRWLVGTNVAYAPYVEFGSRPHQAPLDAIIAWGRRHGLADAASLAVWRRIAERGTRARPYLLPAFRESVAELRARLPQLTIASRTRRRGRLAR